LGSDKIGFNVVWDGNMHKQNFFRRIIAYLIDIVLLFFILSIFGLIFRGTLNIVPDQGFQVWLSILVNFSIPGWLYFVISDFLPKSASIGKRIMNLIVIGEDGQRLMFWQAILRNTLKLLPIEMIYFAAFGLYTLEGTFIWLQIILLSFAFVCILVYLYFAFRSNGQHSLYDLFLRTRVVFKGVSPSDFENIMGDI
jgi:uncharacterized RDD family membrane protein YckC